jgi:hypothetical protein
MKHIKKRWLGLAFAPALFALIGFASPASAANYSGNCAGISAFDGNGYVDITNTGTCTLPTAITASGFIHINSTGAITAQGALQGTDLDIKTTGGAITTQGLTTTNGDLKISSATNITTTGSIASRYSFQANANSGKISVSGTVTSNQSGSGGNILLVATGNIATGSISNSGPSVVGGIEIHANTAANGTRFVIGGTTGTNGINGTINTSTATGGGTNPTFINGGIFITNGNANSTAGIKVNSAGSINVIASGSRSGIIALDARKGTITLPTGALSSHGPANQPAGQIILMGGTLTTVNNTVIDASQDAGAISTNHGVIIAVSTINAAGTNGLQIKGDGNGISTASGSAYALIVPTGGQTVTSTAFTSNNVNNMLWTASTYDPALVNQPLTVAGTGPITLSANGDYARVTVSANPLVFSNKAVTITAKGNIDHQIQVNYPGALTGVAGLTFSGTGAVSMDASGLASGNAGGTIQIRSDKMSLLSSVPSITLKADGNGTGNGGNVNVQPSSIAEWSAPTSTISANGPFGNAVFQPFLGSTAGAATINSTTFNITANAPNSAGDAGTVYFQTSALTLNAATKVKITSNGPTAGTGKGGNITLFPGNIANLKLGTNAGDVQVLADGGSTGGDAGRLNINPFPGSITIDTANAVSAKAIAGNAKGGFVQLVGNPNLSVNPTLTGATINVDGKGTGAAGEIHIFANGTVNLGTAAGSLLLSAKGDTAGTGDGGIIELGYITDLTTSDLSVAGGKGSGSNAKGGIINIHDGGSIIVGSSNFDASGSGDGKGGDVTLNAALPVNLVVVNVNATAGINGNGAGGTFTATSAKGNAGVTLRVNTIIKVDAGSNALVATKAGTIALNGVTCGQWKTGTGTGSTSWPKTYWNCAHAVPEAYETAVPNAVLGLPASFRSTLGTQEVPMYIFDFGASYESYFKGASYGGGLGVSDFTIPYAVIFEYVTGTDVTAYLPGNMMHELGHHIDNYTTPTIASAAPAFVTAVNSTISAMTGTWPSPPNPTCAQVFGTSPEATSLCANWAPNNPWDTFRGALIDPQDVYQEMFANYFQVCSGYSSSIPVKQTSLKSTYANSLRNYFHTVFWPGGCAP